MSEQVDRATNLEQQYVSEYEGTDELLEGLDPERPESEQTTEKVKGVAKDAEAEEHVEHMARDDS